MKFVFSKYLFLIMSAILIAGCKPASPKSVIALVGKLLEPVSVTITPNEDFGDIITSDDSIDIVVEISNNSSDQIRDLNFTIDTSENILDYKLNIDGVALTPGAGGTCQSVLASGASCKYKLTLIPRKQGEFNIAGIFNYTNKVEPQVKNINFHLLSGEPASLVYTNDTSNYSLGIFEQTEAIEKFVDLEVKNAGGLPAKDLALSVNNDDINGAYRLVSHDCPTKLYAGQICHAKVGYTPKNNNYSDPENVFTGQLMFDYIKDPLNNPGKLNGYFSFTSSTIEAKFKTNYAPVDFGTVITGNKEVRSIKLINMGYREGVLKNVYMKNSSGVLIATCEKGSGTMLNCDKPLYDFPFTIEDVNSCFENSVVSYLAITGSPNCIFKLTYWPSVNYLAGTQAIHDFKNSTLSFTYDSKWKGNVNIVTKENIFTIMADFLARGQLEITRVDLNNADIGAPNVVSLSNSTTINFGRLAKIAAAYTSVSYPVKIYYKNIGEADINFLTLKDKAIVPNTIIDINEMGPGPAMPRNFNSYYKSIQQTNCLVIAPTSECDIVFSLSPLKQANETLEDALMYDDITNPFLKYKSLIVNYTDGSSFEDNGTPITSRSREAKMFSFLIAKGKLLFSPLSSLDFGSSLVVGDKSVKNLFLKNIGTGKIAGLQYLLASTLEVPSANVSTTPSGAATSKPWYPYRLSKYADNAETLPIGADFDCLELLRPSSTSFPFAVDSSKILDEGKTCALRIEAKLPKNSTTLNSTLTATDEYKRFWTKDNSGTSDAWMSLAPSTPAVTAKFNYWDGDDNSANDISSSVYFGYKNVSDQISLTSTWKKPAQLSVVKIDPIASSTLFRPAVNYPAVVEVFPAKENTALVNTTTQLFSNLDLSTGITSTTAQRSTNIKAYYNSLDSSFNGGSVSTAMVYMGSTKTSTNFYTTVSFANSGTEIPSEAKVVDVGGDTGFTLTNFAGSVGSNAYLPITSGTSSFNLIFKANLPSAGTFQHNYDVIYKSVLGDRTYRLTVIAEATATTPLLKFEYKNNDITWNTDTISFDIIPDASWITFKSPVNTLSTCDANNNCTAPTLADEIISLSTVASSAASCVAAKNCQFDKKTIRLTNIGTANITDLALDFTKNPSANYLANTILYKMDATRCANPTLYFTDIKDKIAVCQSEITACNNLAPAATCLINVYYTPTVSSSALSDSMFTFSYKTGDRTGFGDPNSKTYVNQFIPIKYEALTTASPVGYQFMRKGIDGVSDASAPATASSAQSISGSEAVGNWADPLNPIPSESSSYPVSLGSYAVGYSGSSTIVNSYYVQDAFPKTQIIYMNVKNDTTTRISFLKANPAPTTATWNQVYPEYDYNLLAFKTYLPKTGASKAIIYASEGCFYGESKDDLGVASNIKGFNKNTQDNFVTKRCQLRIDFSGDITYLSGCNSGTKAKTVMMGGDIDGNCNPYVYKIPFWSYKRSTTSLFKVHVKQFIEPARSTYTGNFSNISSLYLNASTGKLTFTLPTTITESVPALGAITKYRIFWAKDPSYLRTSEIFKNSPSTSNMCWADTADAALPQTINLSTSCGGPAFTIAPGKYWYIKVMARRSTGAGHPNKSEVATFTSDPKIPLLMLATPNNANLTYVDALKSFVDNGLVDTSATYNLTNAGIKCSATANNLTIGNGAGTVTNSKALINWLVWPYIRTGVVPSSNTMGYTANGPGFVQHWLSDAAVAINGVGVVKLYDGSILASGFPGFNSNITANSNNANLISYNKSCSNGTCNNLNVIVGGDNDSTYANGVFYTYATNKAAFVRCYTPIVCPSNTGIKLNNTGCFLKY